MSRYPMKSAPVYDQVVDDLGYTEQDDGAVLAADHDVAGAAATSPADEDGYGPAAYTTPQPGAKPAKGSIR